MSYELKAGKYGRLLGIIKNMFPCRNEAEIHTLHPDWQNQKLGCLVLPRTKYPIKCLEKPGNRLATQGN
jgi:hypothetical protein